MTDTGSSVDVSVIIGFRNWGTRRLRASIASILNAMGGVTGEVVVSDYGSDNPELARAVADELGVVHVYTAAEGPWSRSRALNIGLAVSRGTTLVCTDADMLFTPNSFERIHERVQSEKNATVLLECLDLPAGWDEERVLREGADWDEFARVSKLRGRWGMGGMVGFSRDVYMRVRGLDERMHTYGCEDIDFGERTQRSGNRIVWLDDTDVRMYHMHHEKSHAKAYDDPAVLRVVDANRKILFGDPSYMRNLAQWSGKPAQTEPLVTVAIATHNRPELLRQAILSVLWQSVQDFEVVVIDDGSRDRRAADVVASFNDVRLRYAYQSNAGIAAARNHASRIAIGRYIAVLDDDDVMLPWRLERQLEAVRAGVHGSYGAFVNFDDVTGEMVIFNERAATIAASFELGGAPGHSTWMVERSIMIRMGYDESIPTGEDNNLFLRMLRAGIKFAHCGDVVTLRRMHLDQITKRDNSYHTTAAQRSRNYFRYGASPSNRGAIEKVGREQQWVTVPGGADPLRRVRPYLPDALVKRQVRARFDATTEELGTWIGLRADRIAVAELDEATGGSVSLLLSNVTIVEIADLRRMGAVVLDVDLLAPAVDGLGTVRAEIVGDLISRVRSASPDVPVVIGSIDNPSESRMESISSVALETQSFSTGASRTLYVALPAPKGTSTWAAVREWSTKFGLERTVLVGPSLLASEVHRRLERTDVK